MKFKRGDRVCVKSTGRTGVVCGEYSHGKTTEGCLVDFGSGTLSMQDVSTLELAPYDRAEAAIRTLERMGYTHDGGELWVPPAQQLDDEAWREEYLKRQADGEKFQFYYDGKGWRDRVCTFTSSKENYRPKPKDDGWIEWHGGECPVAPETWVEYVLRNGSRCRLSEATLRWTHNNEPEDIIRYRIVKDAA